MVKLRKMRMWGSGQREVSKRWRSSRWRGEGGMAALRRFVDGVGVKKEPSSLLYNRWFDYQPLGRDMSKCFARCLLALLTRCLSISLTCNRWFRPTTYTRV